MRFEDSLAFAEKLDQTDVLKSFRERFHIPTLRDGREVVYLCGNSLGLQPKSAREAIEQELQDWARLGVRGHLEAKNPWYPYHEFLTEKMARLVGAKPEEVVVMNSLTVNLHLMMVSFYQPTPKRFKILIEAGAFPSDQYAVASQAKFHGFDPHEAIVSLRPRSGEATLRAEDILGYVEQNGGSLALILLGNVNYLTGQAFDIAAITKKAHEKGAWVGFDLAHGAGNLTLNLHQDGPDFAVWCSYKYLNAGPGGIAGAFVHERHARRFDLPRFAGWWGHNKKTRFEMKPEFEAIGGAEGWQLSNPAIFQMATLKASLDLFDEAGREFLAQKRDLLAGYCEFLVQTLPKEWIQQITPANPKERSSQLSFRMPRNAKSVVRGLEEEGFYADYREPDVLRAAPVPLYNRFVDIYRFVKALEARTKSL